VASHGDRGDQGACKECHEYGKPAAIYTPNAGEKTISYRSEHDVPLFESPEEAVGRSPYLKAPLPGSNKARCEINPSPLRIAVQGAEEYA
jgi:hypothetical protein